MLPDIIQKQYPVLRSWLEHREAFQIREDDMATSVKQMGKPPTLGVADNAGASAGDDR